MITTCTACGCLYRAGSEEQANEPDRICRPCFEARLRSLRQQFEEMTPDYGGTLGADGQVHSDADPGL